MFSETFMNNQYICFRNSHSSELRDWRPPIIGKNVIIFSNSVIGRPPMAPTGSTTTRHKSSGEQVKIGDNTIIGANTVIYEDVKIGNNCLIGDGVVIREKVEIGDNTVIGINCKVGTRTKIGSKTRIMDLTNVASDAIIEDNVFVGMGVMMGNDNKMGRTDDWVAEGPVIKEWSTIGMNASILPGVIIGNDVIVGAGSVVTKDVLEKIVVMGIPAKFKRNLTQEEIRSE